MQSTTSHSLPERPRADQLVTISYTVSFLLQVSRSASCAAAPTYGDIRTLNKLVRSIKNEPADLRYWPLKGNMRLIGFPDAAYRNNRDSSSQRGQAISIAQERTQHPHYRGSLVDFESHKINKTTFCPQQLLNYIHL